MRMRVAPAATFFLATAHPQFLEAHTALGGDHLRRDQLLKTVHGSARHVDRVVGAEALGEHVRNTRRFQDRAHWTAGNYARTGSSRPQEHLGSAVSTQSLVWDGTVHHRYAHHAPPGLLESLADGLR